MPNYTVTERFLRYVQIDTQSDPNTTVFPSTEKQKTLSALLVNELQSMGIADAHTDEWGYVYATLPSNTNKKVPVICFCSHVDTAPDCSGTNVKPIVHENYSGADIVLPDDPTQVIRLKDYPYLKNHIGSTIITASGLTLLGADDKSGVAIIMDLLYQLKQHPNIPHGEIKVVFTPDEETGRGTERIDLKKLDADFAYTLDGGELGSFEDETFSADGLKLTIGGVIAHPGYAKEKMVNALKVAGAVLDSLPKNEWCPEATAGREGFVHPVAVNGIAEEATIEFIVRDFDTAQLAVYEKRLENIVHEVLKQYPGATAAIEVREQYRNMKSIIDQHPQLRANALEAYRRAGIEPIIEPVRGGTDGSRLSAMGLPCPNIFTGMQAIHSKHEWIGVRDMEKAVDALIELVKVWEEHAK